MTKFTTITSTTKIQHENWDPTQIAQPISVRSRRTRANAPINNEIFRHMATVVLDPFWKERFGEAADGIFPTKISYSNGVLQYKGFDESTMVLQTNIPSMNAGGVNDISTLSMLVAQASDVILFYQTRIQMYSPADIERINEAASNQVPTEEELGNVWNKMKPRQREVALIEFVKSEKIARGLTPGQCLELEQLVNLSRQLKYANSDTITVRRYRIVDQSFVIYNPDSKRYYINPEVTKIIKFRNQKKKPGKEKLTHFQKWEEFHRSIQETSEAIVRNYTFPVGTVSATGSETDRTDTDTSASIIVVT